MWLPSPCRFDFHANEREEKEEPKFFEVRFRNGWYLLKKIEKERYTAGFDRNGFVRGYFRKHGFDFWRSGRSENSNGRHWGAGNIFPKLVFQLTGKKKKRTMSFDEAWSVFLFLSPVLIIQHTPNEWAPFLEVTLPLGSRMLLGSHGTSKDK